MPLYLKHAGAGKVELKEEPAPTPGEGQILVKVSVVAGNPVDREINQADPDKIGNTVGFEYAGTVSSVGPGATKFQPGDRVTGFAFIYEGCFGEVVAADGAMAFKIPEGMSDEEAATLPTAFVVTAMALYQQLQMPNPGAAEADKQPLLVWGGSTAMGSMALQFARASGASPIVTTASARQTERVKSLGADHVVDYNDPDCVRKIKELTGNKLSRALDGFSHGNSFAKTAECFGEKGGMLVALNPPDEKSERTDIKYEFINSFMVSGKPFKIFSYEVPGVPEVKDFVANWLDTVAVPLLKAGKIKPHSVKIMPNGLNGVTAGWDLYREGKVSGEKLIYRIADTKA